MEFKFAVKTKICMPVPYKMVKTDGISNLNFVQKLTFTVRSLISKAEVENILNIAPIEMKLCQNLYKF